MRLRDLFTVGFGYYLLLALFLYLPIGLLVLFSFNDLGRPGLPAQGLHLAVVPRPAGRQRTAQIGV